MSDINIRDNITGLILAGGQARRMGGTDKGLIQLAGRTMIGHIIDALQPQVSTILINANRNRDSYESYGYPVIEDKIGNFQGPLAGMACGLEHCTTDYIVTVPCDGPFYLVTMLIPYFRLQPKKIAKLALPMMAIACNPYTR